MTNKYNMREYDHLSKIILIGDPTTGKSSIISQLVSNVFNDSYTSTIGINFQTKLIYIDDQKIKLQLFDISGQKQYHTLSNPYYNNYGMGIIVVFDVTLAETFKNIDLWLDRIRNHAPEYAYITLVGNKIDCDERLRVISTETAKTYADKNKLNYVEISAKDSNCVHSLFINMTKHIVKEIIPIVEAEESRRHTASMDNYYHFVRSLEKDRKQCFKQNKTRQHLHNNKKCVIS